jgi:cytochrome b6-f complex iron-sulfur subunit
MSDPTTQSRSQAEDSGGPPSPGRRRMLDILLGASLFAWLGSVFYPILRYLLPPPGAAVKENSVKLGKVKDYEKNSGTLFRIGNKPGILICTATGELRAFSAVCTHLDCTVQFKKDEGDIWCACHNGRYNLQGANISGPPPRPLTPLVVSLQGDEVHVSLAG